MDHHKGYPKTDGGQDHVDMVGDVEAFHKKFDHAPGVRPRILSTDYFMFRHKFHLEEIEEYATEQSTIENELGFGDDADDGIILESLHLQLDALCDAAWVIIGTAEAQFGAARFREAWRRVVAANMAKVRADAGVEGTIDSGRNAPAFDIVKPPGWVAPDHKDLVEGYVLPYGGPAR